MIGFLHTADVHVATFGGLVDEIAPGTRHVHRVDVPLLDDARAGESVLGRVRRHVGGLVVDGATVVVCTCSTLGPVAEQVGETVRVPVLRVDRPSAEDAVRDGGRVVVVVALASALGPATDLLADAARRAGTEVGLVPVVCAGAWPAFEAGDLAGYHRRVADAVRVVVGAGDVVVLAQASMAPVAALLDDLPVRVLSSPGSAVARAVELARAG
jgi:hypothetical protein